MVLARNGIASIAKFQLRIVITVKLGNNRDGAISYCMEVIYVVTVVATFQDPVTISSSIDQSCNFLDSRGIT